MKWNDVFGSVDLQDKTEHSAVRRGALATASVGIQGSIRFFYSVIIGQLLGPAMLAVTNSAISLAQLATLVWPTGSGTAATKFIARARGAEDGALIWQTSHYLARTVLLSSIALAVPSAAFAYFVLAPGDVWLALQVAALAIALSCYNFVRGAYFAASLLPRVVVWDVLSLVIGIGLLFCVIVLDWSSLLLAPLTLSYGIYAIVGWPRTKARAGGTLARELRSEITRFVAWSSLLALATSGFLQLTMVIAQTTTSPTEAGLYAAALSIATPAAMLGSALSMSLFPSMAQASGRGDERALRRQGDLATRGLIVVLGAIFGSIALLAAPLIAILFGSRYADAAPLLLILLAASLSLTLNVAAVALLQAGHARTVRLPALTSLSGLVVGLSAMLVFVPLYSVTGVALAYLAGTLVAGFGPILIVWRRFRMHWLWLWTRFTIGMIVAAALAVWGLTASWSLPGMIAATIGFLALWLFLLSPELRVVTSMRKRSVS